SPIRGLGLPLLVVAANGRSGAHREHQAGHRVLPRASAVAAERADPQVHRNPLMEIFREFTFEAAHRLPHLPEGHKGARLHGHSYRVEVHVAGHVGAKSGWVMDFADIKQAFAPLAEQLDHHYLNEVHGLENPTSEVLARWIWQRLADQLPLVAVV